MKAAAMPSLKSRSEGGMITLGKRLSWCRWRGRGLVLKPVVCRCGCVAREASWGRAQQRLFGRREQRMSNIVHRELLEEELKAVVRAGGYRSKREAVRHALEVLLAANPDLRIRTAVELYRHGKVTLARGAEVAGLELEAFKEKLAAEEIPLLVDESPEEVQAGADLIHRLRRAQ